MQSMGIYTCLKVYVVMAARGPALEDGRPACCFRGKKTLMAPVRGEEVRLIPSFLFSSLPQGYIGPPGLFGLPGADGERVSIFGEGGRGEGSPPIDPLCAKD